MSVSEYLYGLSEWCLAIMFSNHLGFPTQEVPVDEVIGSQNEQ
jgi:hypothetical protein